MEQRRKESVNSENNQKWKQLSEELSVVKRKKVEMGDLVKEVDADADNFVSEAGITDDMVEMKNFLLRQIPLRRPWKKKKKQIHEVQIQVLWAGEHKF